MHSRSSIQTPNHPVAPVINNDAPTRGRNSETCRRMRSRSSTLSNPDREAVGCMGERGFIRTIELGSWRMSYTSALIEEFADLVCRKIEHDFAQTWINSDPKRALHDEIG